MSNGKEMVSITRETAKQAAHLLAAHSTGPSLERDTAEELRDALEKPAQQHQGEPVAYLCKAEGAKWLQYGSKVGAPWKPGEVDVTPLFTHADPGEVERLEAELANLHKLHDSTCYQLSERNALLRDALESHGVILMSDPPQDPWKTRRIAERINSALSERESPSEPDELTDLATWKRRAIEAESKLRTYDPKVVELGEQAMQALLAEPKPNELVLTKCRLCDQLQADLTARDQRIDQLEQQPRVPKGYALVPQSMLLCKEVIGVINFHCGDTDQEEGGQFGQYTDGRLWVGYVLDDDGNKVHGLHLATDEYPEEGSTTLIEFPEPGAEQKPKECGACGGCTNGCQVDKDSPKAESAGAQVLALMESRGEP